MKRKLLTYLLLTAAVVAGKAVETESAADSIELGEIVITGTRTPKTLLDSPVLTRLISPQDLRQASATNLQDLLQTELPGVEFTYAMNQQTNMNMAGFAGQSVLILVDGERLAGETMDNVDFSRLTMNGVERIEVVKGAASALYGSSAAGGVINIITKKATKPWSANLDVRGADHNEWRAGANLSVKKGIVANVLDATHSSIDTYTVCLDLADECDFRNVYGSKTYNIQDRLSLTPTAGLTLTARAGYYFKERYYNPDTPDRYRDFTGGLRGNWQISHKSDLELNYAFDQYDKSDYNKQLSLDIRDYRNVQHSLRSLFNHRFDSAKILTVGADMMYDYITTYQFAPGTYKSQVSADAFAQFDLTLGRHWEVIAAARYDYFSDGTASHFTSKLSGKYRVGSLSLRGGYAGGFRAPSLKEKYMDFDMAGIFNIHGNPALKSETSHNLNISAEYNYRNYNFTLGGNYTFIDNKITTSGILYDSANNPYINYINVPKLKVKGIDATIQGRWDCGLAARLSYAYAHEDNRGGSITQYCPARPHSLNCRLAWTRSWSSKYDTEVVVSGRFHSAVKYESMYMYEPFDTKTIHNPAYTLWKVQLTQTLFGKYALTIAVDNIFNYAPKVYSYNAPITLGANLMVGLHIDLD